jgi:hypothetical protein
MSNETQQMMRRLSLVNRKQVEKIVMRFAKDHHDEGILPIELDQVYRDVIDAVHFKSFFPDNQFPSVKSWEQARQFGQYVSPQFSY